MEAVLNFENNLLNIKSPEELLKAINIFSLIRMCQLKQIKLPVKINIDLLKSIHKFLFGDIFSWSGEINKKFKEKEIEDRINEINTADWKGININEAARELSEFIFELEIMKIFEIGSHQAIMAFTELICKDKEIVIDLDYLQSKSIEIAKEAEMDYIQARENVYEIVKEAMIIAFVKENTYENIASIIEKAGFNPEENIVENIKKLNESRLKIHTVIQIYDLFKHPEKLNEIEKKYIFEIAEGFKCQELLYLSPTFKIKDELEYIKE